MATRTEYLKLIRPDYNDAADIADINANMDAIDAKAKELDESSGKALMEHNQSQAAHAAMAATINALMGPTGNTDTVRNLLNYLANRYKTAAGVSDWKDAPSINLKDVKNFIDQMARGSAVQWNGKKWKNPLTGESGLMDQNGYYCGGPNRANLIIQWGSSICSTMPTRSKGIQQDPSSTVLISRPLLMKITKWKNLRAAKLGPSPCWWSLSWPLSAGTCLGTPSSLLTAAP